MKRKPFLVLLLIIFSLSLATPAQAALGDVTLKVGARGTDVVELQTELNDLGIDIGKVDGIFGSMTKQGVITFQLNHGLVGDGIVGSMTAKALNEAYLAKQTSPEAASVIATAKQYLGVKYQWGGSTPETGFDCSGYISYVFGQNGIKLPRISGDQYTVGTKVTFNDLQPGDLVFFSFVSSGAISHVGIYLGDGQFINASSSKGVTVYVIGPYWKSHYVGACRVL